ncbi:hypothetical protein V6Z11_D07G187400 [Gossypium hirsutum]
MYFVEAAKDEMVSALYKWQGQLVAQRKDIYIVTPNSSKCLTCFKGTLWLVELARVNRN